jgi:anti-sigma regulatory factor (Ser/Thr protein kinase)
VGGQTIIPCGLELTLCAGPAAVAQVWRRVENRLVEWSLAHLAPDARLIVDELVLNACAATPEGEIRVEVTLEPRMLRFAVWDASDRMPRPRPVVELAPQDLDLSPEGWDDNGGWGLPLVLAVSAECGTVPTAPSGKWVCAALAR